MTHNCNIDLTDNNKYKPSGSQTRDNSLQAIANNKKKKKKKKKKLKATPYNDPSNNSKPTNVSRKKTFIVGDSILKHVEGWRLNKRMKSTVSVRSIPGSSTNGMAHHVKGCLEDISPDTVILHHGTSDMNIDNTSVKIATNKVNLASTIQSEKSKIFISGMIIRKSFINKGFIGNQNVNLKLLN